MTICLIKTKQEHSLAFSAQNCSDFAPISSIFISICLTQGPACQIVTPAIYGPYFQVLLDQGVFTHNSIRIYLINQFATTYGFCALGLVNLHHHWLHETGL